MAQKIVIFAARHALIVQRSDAKGNDDAIQLDYQTHKVSRSRATDVYGLSIEVHGIIGLLNLASHAYLIAIKDRRKVAEISGAPVFTITGIHIIPLVYDEASKLIAKVSIDSHETIVGNTTSSVDLNDDTVEHELSSGGVSEDETNVDASPNPSVRRSLGRAVGMPAQLGVYARDWAWGQKWPVGIRNQASSPNDRPASQESSSAPQDQTQGMKQTRRRDALSEHRIRDKLLQATQLLMAQGFYFSYDIDISQRLGNQSLDVPAHESFDPLFFYNRNLASPFIDSGNTSFIVPIMQGFVGQMSLSLSPQTDTSEKSTEAIIHLVSRRSTQRAGFRYMRRGVDDHGSVANFVETEQLMTFVGEADSKDETSSYIQIRGSIPLFFTQSPFAFKPRPILQHSEEKNLAAFKLHFQRLKERYGSVQIVLLTNRKGNEGAISEKYEAFNDKANKQIDAANAVGFEWFDFHKICSGMRYENTKILVDNLESTMEDFSVTTRTDKGVTSSQSGVMRINCMDCLDRTGVIMASFGRRALDHALRRKQVQLANERLDAINTLWAENNDAISKQYTSTPSLKSGFIRTGKRDVNGIITDFGLTLTRFYSNIISDYFSQLTIDYLLGKIDENSFNEYIDSLSGQDPGINQHAVRQAAVDDAAKIVLADREEKVVGSWVVYVPMDKDTIRPPLIEAILLLTDVALYRVSYDWSVEDVLSYIQIDLEAVLRMRFGVYVTSTLTAAEADESKNVGFVFEYREGQQVEVKDGRHETTQLQKEGFLAFKSLPSGLSRASDEEDTTVEAIEPSRMCEAIRRAAVARHPDKEVPVEEAAIVSLEHAQKNTGYLDQWTYALKRMVWG